MHCSICHHSCMDGIMLLEKQICPSCEQKLVCIKAEDQSYFYYVWRIKQLWLN
ncbi:sigma factor G inhibitor Gin [Thermoflavimicrobium dichotomicum]|uniref:sigma factor G inhibitor Gin n=1 Tax=Thermoflavimicrobium dichotomicum TaxID=46223 RepID=UPI003CC658D7